MIQVFKSISMLFRPGGRGAGRPPGHEYVLPALGLRIFLGHVKDGLCEDIEEYEDTEVCEGCHGRSECMRMKEAMTAKRYEARISGGSSVWMVKIEKDQNPMRVMYLVMFLSFQPSAIIVSHIHKVHLIAV